MHLLPLLPGFMKRHPLVRAEWHFENRSVDIVAEGYDAAIGGGFDLSPGIVSRPLAPAHIIAVASPGYMSGRATPVDPAGLETLDGIVMRSLQTGRIRHWMLRDASGREMSAPQKPSIVVNDPSAMRGGGVAWPRRRDVGGARRACGAEERAPWSISCRAGTPTLARSRYTTLRARCCPRRPGCSSTGS